MSFRNFLLISVALHVIVFAVIYFLPEHQAKKAKDFITQLVTPEEAKRPEPFVPPATRKVPDSLKSPRPLMPRPAPVPQPPQNRELSRSQPTPERPVVPGMGQDEGKPLPEGVSPKPETGQRRGEEGSDEEVSSKPGYMKGSRQEGKKGVSNLEKLFDRSIIGETVAKGRGSKKKDDTITFDTDDYRYKGYMRKLKEKIESIWAYPPEALRRGLYGDLKISFTIKKDGSLGAVELVRTSGYPMLDDAALKALRDGEPYWPIPADWGMDSYTITGHFFYTMYGYGIR